MVEQVSRQWPQAKVHSRRGGRGSWSPDRWRQRAVLRKTGRALGPNWLPHRWRPAALFVTQPWLPDGARSQAGTGNRGWVAATNLGGGVGDRVPSTSLRLPGAGGRGDWEGSVIWMQVFAELVLTPPATLSQDIGAHACAREAPHSGARCLPCTHVASSGWARPQPLEQQGPVELPTS